MRTKKKALAIVGMVGVLGAASCIGICNYNQSHAKTKEMEIEYQLDKKAESNSSDAAQKVDADENQKGDYKVKILPEGSKITFDKDEKTGDFSVNIK